MLIKRDVNLSELMDLPNADEQKLRNTYISFRKVNALLSFWRIIYIKDIKPKLKLNHLNSIADIGCGDGYLLQQIGDWATNDGFNCSLFGIEPDARAMQAVDFDHSIQFIHKNIEHIDNHFDIVISNHVLHHLHDDDISTFLNVISSKTKSIAIVNDIKRSFWAMFLFPIIGIWFAAKSFILIDGLRSIRRSFKLFELKELAPSNWSISKPYPFRIVAVYEKNS